MRVFPRPQRRPSRPSLVRVSPRPHQDLSGPPPNPDPRTQQHGSVWPLPRCCSLALATLLLPRRPPGPGTNPNRAYMQLLRRKRTHTNRNLFPGADPLGPALCASLHALNADNLGAALCVCLHALIRNLNEPPPSPDSGEDATARISLATSTVLLPSPRHPITTKKTVWAWYKPKPCIYAAPPAQKDPHKPKPVLRRRPSRRSLMRVSPRPHQEPLAMSTDHAPKPELEGRNSTDQSPPRCCSLGLPTLLPRLDRLGLGVNVGGMRLGFRDDILGGESVSWVGR
ncbi:hypothetical protein QBC39DRAFT_121615 [Podospora conica]|nr:hypothetical protein QBC39DRAFT_121615 [Schizothecium conicum]